MNTRGERREETPSRRDASASRLVVLLAALLQLGCPPVQSTRPPVPARDEAPSIDRPVGARGAFDLRPEASVQTWTVESGVAVAWPVMSSVFEALEVPPTRVDDRELIIGTDGFTGRTIEGRRLSAYVDCGVNVGGSRVDQYQVTIYLMVRLDGITDDVTVVTTYVDSFARARGTSGNAIRCVPRGLLARRVSELIIDRIS